MLKLTDHPDGCECRSCIALRRLERSTEVDVSELPETDFQVLMVEVFYILRDQLLPKGISSWVVAAIDARGGCSLNGDGDIAETASMLSQASGKLKKQVRIQESIERN